MPYHAAIMILAGIGIPLLAALNARLGANIGAPATAALILFLVAALTAGLATLVTGARGFTLLASQPKHLFFAGALVAFYVLSITYVAPTFGVGNAVFFVLLGQLASAAIIDHFGLFGAQVAQISPLRLGGILLMAAGLALTQLAGRG